MAGHSKFKNIMHRKGRADAVRARQFTKLAREITTAAKAGMPDPAMNPRLRLAVANARAESMPKENIDRAIKKAIGGDAESYDEIRYEGFGPGGVGLIVEVLTDNRNRAASNVRTIFAKNGGAMGESGSVAFMFERAGAVNYPTKTGSEDEVMEAAIEAGAEDVESDIGTDQWDEGEGHTVYTGFAEMNEVAAALEAKFGAARSTRPVWRPKTQTPVGGDDAQALVRLIDALEDDDDVQHVYSNAEFSDEALAAMAG